jgi:Ca2+-transporting ATPase
MFNFPDHQYDFSTNPCQYFEWGKQKASTMSLTVLVLIEMFNAINALSQEKSLLQTGLFLNPLLIIACCVSFGLHLVILYHHDLGDIFGVDPLSRNDWILCIGLSLPVIFIDEFVKIFVRRQSAAELAERQRGKSKKKV